MLYFRDKIGKEIVTRYSSNLQTDKTFYTDSNGREMLKRVRNYRSTWNLKLMEPISGNYYPVTSKITLKDEKKQLKLNVFVDRAQGGSSLEDGDVELMVNVQIQLINFCNYCYLLSLIKLKLLQDMYV